MALISYGDTGFELKIYVLEFHFNEATRARRAPNEPSFQVGPREKQARPGSFHLPTKYCLLERLDLFTRYFTSTHKTFIYKLHNRMDTPLPTKSEIIVSKGKQHQLPYPCIISKNACFKLG